MRRGRWKSAGVLLLAGALLLSGTGGLETRAAGKVNTQQTCSLEVSAEDLYILVEDQYQTWSPDGLSDEERKELEEVQSQVKVRLYRPAEISEAGRYTAAAPFTGIEGFDPASVNNETTAADWNRMAKAALKAVTKADGSLKDTETGLTKETTASEHSVTFTELETGLYLVAAEQVETDRCVYTFAPYLVSLPNLYSTTGEPDSGEWIYNLTGDHAMGLKPEQGERFGEMAIYKKLTGMSGLPDSQTTFVFQIDITTPDQQKEQRIEALNFTGTGEQKLVVKKIPVGSQVSVTEIYQGAGYELADSSLRTQTVTVTAGNGSGTSEVAVSFTNEPNGGTTGGYGVENRFYQNEEGQYQYDDPNAPAQPEGGNGQGGDMQ